MYEILESRAYFESGALTKVIVLVCIFEGDIRAIASDRTERPGYDSLKGGEPLNDDLLQRVAGYGYTLPDARVAFGAYKRRYGCK